MTPEQIEMHRKRFEDLVCGVRDISRYPVGPYLSAETNIYWMGYLLCAENIEVELPDSWFSENHQEYILSNSEVEKYLESQGIKVKP